MNKISFWIKLFRLKRACKSMKPEKFLYSKAIKIYDLSNESQRKCLAGASFSKIFKSHHLVGLAFYGVKNFPSNDEVVSDWMLESQRRFLPGYSDDSYFYP